MTSAAHHRHVAPAPGRAATSGYAAAVAVRLVGAELVWVSGQVALDASAAVIAPGDVERQSLCCLEQICELVATTGGTVNDIVKLTVYLTDIEELPAYRRARQRIFGERSPASDAVEVAALLRPGLVVEIAAMAVIGR